LYLQKTKAFSYPYEMKESLDKEKIPQHVAIIMDGNGRWAQQKGAMRIFGHKNAITAVRDSIEGSAELGVKYLTLYAFSTENWSRPADEVRALMELLVDTISGEVPTMMKNNIRLLAIGDTGSLTQKGQRKIGRGYKHDRTKQRAFCHPCTQLQWKMGNSRCCQIHCQKSRSSSTQN
jgi:undecaprenyl diphosphate synthase